MYEYAKEEKWKLSKFILELRGVTKTFPGVKALDDVHFDLRPGEIHSIMGENGAGKSTFIKIITGVYTPDSGEMIFDGKAVVIHGTRDSQKLGIAAIYQHVTSYPDLSVTENIFIGHEEVHPKTKRIFWNSMHKKAKELLDSLSANFAPTVRMGSLSVAQQQIVEIAKALSVNAKVIIMDEPTAALSNRESEELYRITKQLRDDGVAIIFISHRMEDFDRLADRVTVLRDAKYIGTWEKEDINHDQLVMAMVGREITQMFPKRNVAIGEEILKVEHLGRQGFFKDVTFTLHKGEIVALTGLVGAGRTEVCEAIYGITQFNEGHIFLNGEEVSFAHPNEAIERGIGYLPEDRLGQGLILDWELYRNISLSSLDRFSAKGVINIQEEKNKTKEISEKLLVKATSVFDKASTLSGGNQQKIVVAKLLTSDLKVIILDEPTVGLDIKAQLNFIKLLRKLSQKANIILVTHHLEEIFEEITHVALIKDETIFKQGKKEDILNSENISDTFGLELKINSSNSRYFIQEV